MSRLVIALLCLSVPLETAAAVECDMKPAFAQADSRGRETTAVWSDASTSALLFADNMNINTDGTRRSYSVSDFWGEAKDNGALNNLCNAMSDACTGLNDEQLRGRRILTQDAKAKGWPAGLLAQTKISASIIPFRNGKPCPEVDGFLVSATALHKPNITDACDISNYADALTVSSIVLPKRANRNTPTPFEARAARLGDLVVAMSSNGTVTKYAVVGDSGPSKELGEISIALAGGLLGKAQPPINYRQIRGKTPYQGQAWTVGKTFVLIFPNTRKVADPYLTQARIDSDAKAAFEAWGGDARLKACAAVYKRK